jgi:hypothetical protein
MVIKMWLIFYVHEMVAHIAVQFTSYHHVFTKCPRETLVDLPGRAAIEISMKRTKRHEKP